MTVRFSVLILVILINVGCKTTISTFQTTDPDKIGVKSNRFSGTIFKSSYPQKKLLISDTVNLNRFTPTENQIKSAETILILQIQEFNNPKVNQSKGEYVDKNLNSYFRQYVGFIDEKGDSIIHINFYWNKYTLSDRLKGYSDGRLSYTSDYSIMLDGGVQYWKINVNLTIQKLERLEVNGIG
jgi:hypothetical protein